MRPPGEIRQALFAAASELHAQRVEPTWRDLAVHAGVGWRAARVATENMVRAGWLEPVGYRRVPHANRPMRTLRPTTPRDLLAPTQPHTALAGVVGDWARAA